MSLAFDVPALAGVLPWLLGGMAAAWVAGVTAALARPLAWLAPILAVAGGVLATLGGGVLLAGASPISVQAEPLVLGFALVDLRYDGLSGAFLAALGLSASAAALSICGLPARSRLEAAAFPVFLLSMALVLGAANGFAFLFAWELMATVSALLVIGLRPSRSVLSAGYLYLAMTHVATSAILIAFAMLTAGAGGELGFEAWRMSAATGLAPLTRDLVFVLVLVGFGTKAGLLPLHAWLPRAHPVAPSHVSAVMSGVMIKTGIYGLVRVLLDILGGGPDWWGLIIVAVGAASAVIGALYALMQDDLKRLLAFSSIENVGIILLGVGSALLLGGHGAMTLATLALSAALLHTINHAVFKTLLFLAAGQVLHATRLRDMNRLGGLARTMPLTALGFVVGAAAISGLPPLNGFASEWLTFQGLLAGAGSTAIPAIPRFLVAAAIGALALTAALAVAAFVKASGLTFLGLPRGPEAAGAHEAAGPQRAAILLLALGCVLLGTGAGAVAPALSSVAQGVLRTPSAASTAAAVVAAPRAGEVATCASLGIGLLLACVIALVTLVAGRAAWRARRVDAWTCGIAPQPEFQYSASGFVKPVRLFFRRILLPERTVEVEYHAGTRFPIAIRYHSEITLVLEDRLFRPLHGLGIQVAQLARRLQAGAIQLYLAYTVVAVLVLLLWKG